MDAPSLRAWFISAKTYEPYSKPLPLSLNPSYTPELNPNPDPNPDAYYAVLTPALTSFLSLISTHDPICSLPIYDDTDFHFVEIVPTQQSESYILLEALSLGLQSKGYGVLPLAASRTAAAYVRELTDREHELETPLFTTGKLTHPLTDADDIEFLWCYLFIDASGIIRLTGVVDGCALGHASTTPMEEIVEGVMKVLEPEEEDVEEREKPKEKMKKKKPRHCGRPL